MARDPYVGASGNYISFSRWTSNKEPFKGVGVRIEINSKVVFMADLTMEQFADAVTGLSVAMSDGQISLPARPIDPTADQDQD